MQLHYPHPSPLTVDSKGISPPNDITCSYAYMAMLCVLSVLHATNTHYVHRQVKASLATIMCMMDKTTSGFLP